MNSVRRDKNSEYICTQYWSIQIYKASIGRSKGREKLQHNNIGDFNTPLSAMSKSSSQKINK
jgi:hypothetical protein